MMFYVGKHYYLHSMNDHFTSFDQKKSSGKSCLTSLDNIITSHHARLLGYLMGKWKDKYKLYA